MAGVTFVKHYKGTVPTSSPWTTDHFTSTSDDVMGCMIMVSQTADWDAVSAIRDQMGFGYWDNTNSPAVFNSLQASWYALKRHNLNSGGARNHSDTTHGVIVGDATSPEEGTGTISEYDSGGNKGITITWTGAGGSGTPSTVEQWTYIAIVFYGTGGANFIADYISLPAGAGPSTSTYDLGFVPDQVLFLNGGRDLSDALNLTRPERQIGAVINEGTYPFPTRCYGTSQDSSSPVSQSGYFGTSRIVLPTPTAAWKDWEVSDFNAGAGSDEMELKNYTGSSSGLDTIIIAWNYDDSRQCELHTSPCAEGSTTWAESGASAEPELVLLVGCGIPSGTEDSVVTTDDGDQASWFISVFDDTTGLLFGGMSEDDEEDGGGAQKTECWQYIDDARTALLRTATGMGVGGSEATLVDSGASPSITLSATGWSFPVTMQGDDFATTDVDTGTDKITVTSHTYRARQRVRLSTTDTLPSPLSTGTDYYIVDSPGANDFQLATTSGGSAINITDTGTGTHTINTPEIAAWSLLFPKAAAGAPTGNGDLASGAAAISGSGTSQSNGNGALDSVVSTMDGSGVSQSLGNGDLASGDSALAGEGTVQYKGNGDLAAQDAAVAGSGTSQSSGNGDLPVGTSALAGSGTSQSLGNGALDLGDSAMAGSGGEPAGAPTGNGDLASDDSTIDGSGRVAWVGNGALDSDDSTLAGSGVSASSGNGVLDSGDSSLAGSGTSQSLGNGALAANDSSLEGSGTSQSAGNGDFAADASTMAGSGRVYWVGNGDLPAQAANMNGSGISQSLGNGDLASGASSLAGDGDTGETLRAGRGPFVYRLRRKLRTSKRAA